MAAIPYLARLERPRAALGASAALAPLATTLAVLGLWELASRSGAVDRASVPPASEVARELVRQVGDPTFQAAAGATAASWALGLLITVALAVPCGLALGASTAAYRSTRFLVDFLRTIPPVTIVPLAALLYGATLQMKLVLIVYGSTWPLLLQAVYGVHQIEPSVHDTARAFGLGRWLRATRIVIPSAAPFMATGLRLAATSCLLLSLGAELVGNAPGLGHEIAVLQSAGAVTPMYAFIVASALLGVLVNAGFARAERAVLSWHASYREEVHR
jgi:ABC-type nitrate/sulfonate/bicarbonate transport system permease component